MPTIYNGFEAGTLAASLTAANSGGPGQWAFDSGNQGTGTGASLTYDNTHTAHGSQALKVLTGSTSTTAVYGWSTSLGASFTTVWFRAYYYFTANPAALCAVWACSNAGTLCSRMRLNASGILTMVDSANTVRVTATNAVNLNAWFRVEGFVVASATVGQMSLSLYNTMDSTTATETDTSAASFNTGTTITQALYGIQGVNIANETYWMDDVAASTVGAIGAYSAVATGAGTNNAATGTDGGTGPSGGTHELIGVDDAVGFP